MMPWGDAAAGMLELVGNPERAHDTLTRLQNAQADADRKTAEARKAEARADAKLKELAEREAKLQHEADAIDHARKQLQAQRDAVMALLDKIGA